MNVMLRSKGANFYYGDEDDTISYVTAMLYFKGEVRKFGRFVGNTLNKAEHKHMEMAINEKIKSDMRGFDRLIKAGFVEGNIGIDVVEEDSYWRYVEHITSEPREPKIKK
jgi:hypothetical protein